MKNLDPTLISFWKAFDFFSQQPGYNEIFSNKTEQKRFECLLAFTAMDATLNSYWKDEVLPEWDSVMFLIENILEDHEELRRLTDLTMGALSKAQLASTLRFIATSGEPEKFSPSFVDVASLLLILRKNPESQPDYMQFVNSLFRLQKLRSRCIHTGKDFTEFHGQEALQLVQNFRNNAEQFSYTFAKTPKRQTQKQKLRVA